MAVIITEYVSFLNMLIIPILILILSITIHEFAHALVADKLGDPTAKIYGRLTLNPLKHIDPLGLLTLFVFRIGWGKPIPIDSYNFKNPKKDEILVALAGPLSNFILSILLALILKNINTPFLIYTVLIQFISLNLFLGVFNLLPIWPLDGSKIVLNILPIHTSISLQEDMEKYGYLLLILLAYTGLLPKIVQFITTPILKLLI